MPSLPKVDPGGWRDKWLPLVGRAEAAEARVAELEGALHRVMSLGYIEGGWWKVATPINTDALAEARDALKGQNLD